MVYLFDTYAVKVFEEKYRYNFLKEVKFLTLLQPFGFVPELYFVDFDGLKVTMQRLGGRRIGECIGRKVVDRCLECCFILDVLGIEKQEMNHPGKHIIVDGGVYFIDFERARLKKRPSNLTQFTVYLKKFGIKLEKNLIRRYKFEINRKNFEIIRRRILKSFE